MNIRFLHGYIGMLIAPAVLFFSLTGILQIYSLHEARPGYSPPSLIEKLGRVHKDQVFAPGEHHAPPPGAPGPKADGHSAGQAPDDDDATPVSVTLLKLYFAAVAAGLIASTLFGVWMGVRPGPRRRIHLILLGIGTSIPIALVTMTA